MFSKLNMFFFGAIAVQKFFKPVNVQHDWMKYYCCFCLCWKILSAVNATQYFNTQVYFGEITSDVVHKLNAFLEILLSNVAISSKKSDLESQGSFELIESTFFTLKFYASL